MHGYGGIFNGGFMKSEQEVKFFIAEDGLSPFSDLAKKINNWIAKESKTTWKVRVDAISHNVDTFERHSTYSAMLLYHYSNEGD